MELVDQIEQLVLSGDLPAGARLDEMSLARRFNVSRTPIREALRQLASTGLIELIPNRGAFTASLSEAQLNEMFVAMAEIEAACARRAASAMTPAERQAFKRLHERMGALVEPNDIRAFGEMNDAFHFLIYRGAHNRVLEEMATRLRKRLSLYRRSQLRTSGRLKRSFREQDAVVQAILAGDAAGAHAAMLAHFDMVEASAQSLLKDLSRGAR